jgi:hypothetical protein
MNTPKNSRFIRVTTGTVCIDEDHPGSWCGHVHGDFREHILCHETNALAQLGKHPESEIALMPVRGGTIDLGDGQGPRVFVQERLQIAWVRDSNEIERYMQAICPEAYSAKPDDLTVGPKIIAAVTADLALRPAAPARTFEYVLQGLPPALPAQPQRRSRTTRRTTTKAA